MSDIFREVEEDVQREKLEKFWKKNGGAVIALVVVGLAGVGGWQVWDRYQTGLREKDSAAFSNAQNLTDSQAKAKAFGELAKNAGGGYAVLSRMEQANALLAGGKRDQAVAMYKDIAAGQSGSLAAVARLRAGWAQADTAPRAELQTLLQPLLDNKSAWRLLAQEVLAYSDYRSGKLLVASSEFAKLADDAGAPETLRNRARAFVTFLSTGGATEVGTVPPPAPPPPPAGAAAP